VRKSLPMVIMMVTGVVYLLAQYIYQFQQLGVNAAMDKWATVISVFTFAVGAVNLFQIHGATVARRRPEWVYSVFLLATMVGYGLICVVQTTYGPAAEWFYNSVLLPASSTTFSLLGFFVVSAGYRSFRVRSSEAAVLALGAVLVMFGTVPLGNGLVPGWSNLSNWLNNYVSAGSLRAITIGASLGALAISIRILLGLERAHLGGAGA